MYEWTFVVSSKSEQTETGLSAAPNATIIEPVAFEPMGEQEFAAGPAALWPKALIGLFFLLTALVLFFLFTARSVLIEPQYNGTAVNNAKFELSGGIHLWFGGRFLVRPGAFSASVSHPEYKTASLGFHVTQEQQQSVVIELQRKPDVFDVSTTPPEAEVLVDGELVGTTPLMGLSIEAGSRSLSLRHPRYLLVEEELQVEGGGNTVARSFNLEPAWAEVTVDTLPQGATVFSDEREIGKTPLTAEVFQGLRQLSFHLSKFKTSSQELNVMAGDALQLETVVLDPADAMLALESTPLDAGVLVNGVYSGQTPVTVALKADENSVVELFKQGYKKQSRALSYSAGEQQALNIALSPALGLVTLNVTPVDSSVSINGRSLSTKQTLSKRLSLPSVPQTFRVTRKGYLPFEKTITPRPGFKQTLNVTLLTPAAAKAAKIKSVFRSAGGQQMRLIKPGRITMGASRREAGRRANENLRPVVLQRPFYISATEVTNGEYRKFDFKHSSKRVEDKSLNADAQPVVRVAWVDAAQYCNWLSEQEGLALVYEFKEGKLTNVDQQASGYRLPTEAEWSYSARKLGKEMLKFPWGQEWPVPPGSGNFADIKASYILGRTLPHYEDGYTASAPVGKFTPNQYELYDMGGNVAEWVHDFYAPGQPPGSKVDPFGPKESNYHVVRGSSWRHGSLVELRLSYRDYADRGRDDLGFRVARYLD
ncbi:MAG: SUMF1/EgtB/PvdO family nonheme iron enzyme [Pseudomonadales bacterium]